MDAGTARRHGYRVGDRVRVLLRGAARPFRVVGLFGFGDRGDFGAVTFAAFDLPTAQAALGTPGTIDRVYVQRAAGVGVNVLRTRLEGELGPGYEVLTADVASARVGRPVRDFLRFFTAALLGFALVGVVLGAFVIFNTFTILVAQRTRELGLLRAMGATGGQVVASVVLEALAIGVVVSALGLAAGIGLGVGLLGLLRTLGLDLPATTTVVLGRTVVVSFAVGVVTTVVAALVPALRAARVPPVAAIVDVPERAPRLSRMRVAAGLLAATAGVVVVVAGIDGAGASTGILDQARTVAVGALALLLGVVLVLPAVARPSARLVGAPLRALGASGRLARANAARNPRRTAVTASALVIGLALVGLTATFGASARASVGHDTAAGIRADTVVKADGFAPFSTEVLTRVRAVPGVDVAAGLRFADARLVTTTKSDAAQTVAGIDPRHLAAVVDLGITRGSTAGLGDGGVLVSDDTASRLGLHVGDAVTLDLS